MTDWDSVPSFGVLPPDARPTPRLSAYAVLRRADGALALVRAPAGVFLPGGGLEAGEGVAQALDREAREECGLRVSLGAWRTRAVDHVHVPSEGRWVAKRSTFVEATVAGPADGPREPGHAVVWLAPALVPAALTHPGQRWAVAQWLASAAPGSSGGAGGAPRADA